MEIDALKNCAAKPGSTNACYRCGKVGHFSRDCPRAQQVRGILELTQEDVEEVLADHAVRLDLGTQIAKWESIEENIEQSQSDSRSAEDPVEQDFPDGRK